MQLTWTAHAGGSAVNLVYGEESVVSYLPLSHVAAQLNDLWICMKFAATTYFAEPDALKVRRTCHVEERSTRFSPPHTARCFS